MIALRTLEHINNMEGMHSVLYNAIARPSLRVFGFLQATLLVKRPKL